MGDRAHLSYPECSSLLSALTNCPCRTVSCWTVRFFPPKFQRKTRRVALTIQTRSNKMFFVKFSLKLRRHFIYGRSKKTLLFLSHFFGYKVSPFVGTTRRHFFLKEWNHLKLVRGPSNLRGSTCLSLTNGASAGVEPAHSSGRSKNPSLLSPSRTSPKK